jgi:hypothetical protein
VSNYLYVRPYDPDTTAGRDAGKKFRGDVTPREMGPYTLIIKTPNIHAEKLVAQVSSRDAKNVKLTLTYEIQEASIDPRLFFRISDGSAKSLHNGRVNERDINAFSSSSIGRHTVELKIPASVFNNNIIKFLELDARSKDLPYGYTVESDEADNDKLIDFNASSVMAPGIYVAGRPLKGFAISEVGTHQYVIMIPRNRTLFRNRPLVDLGDGRTWGIVLGAHNRGDLEVEPNQAQDLLSIRQYINRGRYGDAFFPRLVDRVRLSRGRGVDATIRALLRASDNYVRNESKRAMPYPSDAANAEECFFELKGEDSGVRNLYNSNSWAQSLIEYGIGRGRVTEDFPLCDTFHRNRIPRSYFTG